MQTLSISNSYNAAPKAATPIKPMIAAAPVAFAPPFDDDDPTTVAALEAAAAAELDVEAEVEDAEPVELPLVLVEEPELLLPEEEVVETAVALEPLVEELPDEEPEVEEAVAVEDEGLVVEATVLSELMTK